jgi:hypothetical protein
MNHAHISINLCCLGIWFKLELLVLTFVSRSYQNQHDIPFFHLSSNLCQSTNVNFFVGPNVQANIDTIKKIAPIFTTSV